MVSNNPARHNAVSLDMWQAVPKILDAFACDDAIHVVVLSGAGGKAFVSGADISEFGEKRGSREAVLEYNRIADHAHRAIVECKKPTIAMIQGYCIGGGLAVALACDLRIASENSRFGVPAARLGLGYGYSGIKRLADLVGPSFAKEIFFTARPFDTTEALQMGLVNRVKPAAELETYGSEYAAWISTLARCARRAIALDNRGHGQSTKLHDPAEYHTEKMVGDVLALLDHLRVARADLLGYSMGARICAFLAAHHPDRARALILGGLGIHLVEGVGLPESIAEALEAPSLADVTDPVGRQFRAFAEQTRSDLRALAACIRGSRQTLSHKEAASIRAPTLIAVGTKDTVAGSAQALAAIIPGAQAVDIPGRDHMLAGGGKGVKTAGVGVF